MSLPATTQPLNLPGEQLIEWGGAVRWLRSENSAEVVRQAVANLGGQATLFRDGDKAQSVFHPLPAPMMDIHKRLKLSFDPHRIFNSGRMYTAM